MGASVYLNGSLPDCPAGFNAARYCLGADVPGDKTALIAVDPAAGVLATWSFDALRDAVLRAAGAYVAAGAVPGDRVVLLLGDVPAFPIAYFGAIAAGLVATPLSSQLSDTEVQAICDSVEPAVIVGGAGDMQVDDLTGPVGDFAETGRDDPALLVFTSGSSGRPKGVLHAQRAFWARQSMAVGWHGIGPGDRVMHAGAFNWTYTLGVGLADAWSVGATAIVNAGSRDPDVWSALARQYKPTVFAAAPGVYRRILKYGDGLKAGFASLRHAVTAGERLSPVIAQGWADATGKALLESLGMSEVSTYVSAPPGRERMGADAGWPQPGRQVAVLGEDGVPVARGDVGELAVHRTDPGLFLGYWRDDALTAAAYRGDWFCTGDLVRMGADGAIDFVGRRDDQMNAQGYRVDPGEVEAALLAVPGVAECGVTELPVSEGLSVIAAWVVVAEGAEVSRDDVLGTAGARLAAYKLPREVFRVDSLPVSANGKLLRRKLAGLAREGL